MFISINGEGHERHVAEPHATTSQPPTSHPSHATSNTGSKAVTKENHYFVGTVAEDGSQDNDANANADLPASENDIRYLEGHHPEL